jgi:tetratricopeptide (TPR) repeat protein
VVERQGRYAAARGHYLAALALGAGARDRLELAQIWHRLGGLDQREGRVTAAADHLERAAASAEATFGPRHPRTAVILRSLADLLREQGAFDRARAVVERALAIQEAALGPDHVEVATTLTTIGALAHSRGDEAAALAPLQRALAIAERASADELVVAALYDRIGEVESWRGAYDEAARALDRALDMRRRRLGPDHPDVGTTLLRQGTLAVLRGDSDAALERYRAALALLAVLGPEHPSIGDAENGMGVALGQKGRWDEAAEHYRRAGAIYARVYGPAHAKTARVRYNVADGLLNQHRYAEAAAEGEAALALFEQAYGPRHAMVGYALTLLGGSWVERHEPARALPLLERALAIREANPYDDVGLGDTLAFLARALWDSGRDRARARALGLRARDAYVRGGAFARPAVADVDAWLAATGSRHRP